MSGFRANTDITATDLSISKTVEQGFITRHAHVVIETPLHPHCDLCVVIPVRDEEERLRDALAALALQVDDHGRRIDAACYEVIVLCNNCSDASIDVARRFAVDHPALRLHVLEVTLPDNMAHVGVARRLLMDEAAARLASRGKWRGVIAMTDADSVVEPGWVWGILEEVRRGADAVGGRIVVDSSDLAALDPVSRSYHLHDVGYRTLVTEIDGLLDPVAWDPLPRHFQHFGPSLAVTVDAYREVGGIPPLPWLEDVALYDRLVRHDARIRHSPLVRLRTSGRPAGRTGFGFAVQLGLWREMGMRAEPFQVPSAGAVAALARSRQRLRQLWRHHDWCGIEMVAEWLLLDRDWLADLLDRSVTFGSVMQAVVAEQQGCDAWNKRWPLVEIGASIRELRELLPVLRSSALPRPAQSLEQVESVALLSVAD